MKPLDELREELWSMAPQADQLNGYEIRAIFTRFEKSHPGLVDLTVTCRVCGGKMNAATVENDGEVVSVAWGHCPACAEEAGDE